MAALWPLRLRSLHVDFCAGERVMERESARVRTVALHMITGPGIDHFSQISYTHISTPANALENKNWRCI
ncbi:hypothetical protein EFO53_07560 [Lacticaseibacillus rhamnosus]|nr:hypothetical protein [Lacticaseibacillus rhamnosus]CAR90775.1 Putative protein without homology [Lacticaseibacillus rhamnosus Lc 705]MCT3149714.1 hypothetical protein [Lacticaseibacillus rhamnosus]MCT3154908.1 hypothetical protein [Lacticaseibacillus rhamnosus]MCT3159064.1 hypothetical protein [Lacticaseibacillus rhamnosus]